MRDDYEIHRTMLLRAANFARRMDKLYKTGNKCLKGVQKDTIEIRRRFKC